jgi:hypothetical protein
MRNYIIKLSDRAPEAYPPEKEGTVSPAKKRLSKKKIYVTLFAVTAIAIIATATLMIPQGSAIIPLNVNYTVGEKMVYDTTMTASFQYENSTLPNLNTGLTNSTNVNLNQTVEVTGFDGEYYTLNHTTTLNVAGKPISVSLIEKMNKTGYSTYLFNIGSTQQEIPNNGITSNFYLAQLLSKPEVRVGDSVEVPFPSVPNSSIGVTGDLTMTFKGVQNLTVPAGTYNVFRIDLTTNNLQINYKSPLSSLNNFTPANTIINLEMHYQIYIEYGTMRMIKSSAQETTSTQSGTLNYSMTTNTDMTLTEHIKPS